MLWLEAAGEYKQSRSFGSNCSLSICGTVADLVVVDTDLFGLWIFSPQNNSLSYTLYLLNNIYLDITNKYEMDGGFNNIIICHFNIFWLHAVLNSMFDMDIHIKHEIIVN